MACRLLYSCAAGFLFSTCGVRAPEHVGSVVCGTRALVEALELSSCGVQAQLPCGMWDLSSLTRDRTHVPCIARRILYHWTTREVLWFASFFPIFVSFNSSAYLIALAKTSSIILNRIGEYRYSCLITNLGESIKSFVSKYDISYRFFIDVL